MSYLQSGRTEVVVAADETVDVPVDVPVSERQQWLLDQLAQERRSKAVDVGTRFRVTEKTARRDIADLKEGNLIEFLGAPKTGLYRLKEPA